MEKEKEKSSELQLVRSFWARTKSKSPIYNFLLNDIEIFTAESGFMRARLRVLPVHLNSKGTLHGTVSACLTDWAGGMAIATVGLEKTGVSTDIHTTYISTAKEGDLIEVEARVNKLGASLAFTAVEIRHAGEDGNLICTGTHTKYIRQ